ncbi:MAG: Trk system potassium transporter TrkA [Chloroflexota bacterium]
MYIIIAGAGLVGFHIASILEDADQEVVVVDQSAEAVENIRRQLDVKTIVGNAAVPRILREAEANRADLLVAATDSDETNMITCFVAKELGARTTAARIRNPEYSGYFITTPKSPTAPRKVVRPKSLGIDILINPEVEAANEITDILFTHYPTPIEAFADGRVQIREFRVEREEVVDKPLGDIAFPQPCVVAAIIRSGGTITPSATEIIQAEDRIYLLAAREFMDELGEVISQPQHPARNVVILGGGHVGLYIAEKMERRGVLVKIINSDPDRSRYIAENLQRTMVVQGDGTDRDLLIAEGVPAADAFLAVTRNDELNILSGLLAKSLGVYRSMILINKPEHIPLAEAVGVDVAASPFLITARKITRFALHGGAICSALIGGMQVQAVEFITSPTARIVNQQVGEAGLPPEAIVGAIIRNDTVIIPPQDSVIQPDDHVIVISPPAVMTSVEKLFKPK